MMEVKFGYYPNELDLTVDDVAIQTLPDFSRIDQNVNGENYYVKNGWLYCDSRVFGLSKTHVLAHKSSTSLEHLNFLVWCLSFFTGIRLTTTEAGFVDATPLLTRKLVDFQIPSIQKAVQASEVYWHQNNHDEKRIKNLMGIIHALFFAQNPKHFCFERFMYFYVALDGCYALFSKTFESLNPKAPNNKKIQIMCEHLGIDVPAWAVLKNGKTEISNIRNDLMHEALFLNEPLGFVSFGNSKTDDITLEMEGLICRLLIAVLIDANCEYVKTPLNTRNIFSW